MTSGEAFWLILMVALFIAFAGTLAWASILAPGVDRQRQDAAASATATTD